MSLINQMLRDLDRRGATESAREPAAPAPVTPVPAATRRGWRLLGLVPLLAALPLAYFLLPLPTPPVSPPGVDVTLSHAELVEPAPSQAGSAGMAAPAPGDAPPAALSAPVARPDPAAVAARAAVDSGVPAPEPEPEPVLAPVPEPLPGTVLASPFPGAAQLPPGGERDDLASRSRPGGIEPGRPLAMARQADLLASAESSTVRTPATLPAKSGATAVRRVTPEKVRESAADVYATALVQLDDGRLREAMVSLRHALTLNRGHAGARRMLAMLLLNDGERSRATELLEEGLVLDPEAAPLLALRVRLLLEQGEAAGAIRLLEPRRAATIDDLELLSLLGSAYQQTRQFDRAVEIYRLITARQPDNGRALAGLAIALDATGAGGEALPLYRAALASNALPAQVSEYARQRVSAISVER